MPLRFAVVGAGRAGRARIRALREHPETELGAVVTREGIPLARVLEDPAIDALCICTPNLLHAPMARHALGAGKHVAVEYPLAPDPAAARELFELARQSRRILHVEHIELLSPSQRAQRERAGALGRPTGGALEFSAGTEGWIADARSAGSPALRALARLHRLLDLFGAAEVDRARLQTGPAAGYRLAIELRFAQGGRTALREIRAAGLERSLRWKIECELGALDDPAAESPAGLFRADLDCFVGRIRGGQTPYVSEPRVLEALALVEQIETHTMSQPAE